jgi:hypothetical protein
MNEKKQVEALDRLVSALGSCPNGSAEETRRAVVSLEKVKDELSNEETPDSGRIKKWLETARGALKTLDLGKDVFDLAQATLKDLDSAADSSRNTGVSSTVGSANSDDPQHAAIPHTTLLQFTWLSG